MKTLFTLLSLMPLLAFSQQYIPITDNMNVATGSWIKFAAGNYSFTDAPADGVVRINNASNVIIDGDSCFVDGGADAGYFIMITNSHYVTIKNFDSVYNYKYAVWIHNSDHITINGNDFSGNKVDSSGWIDVWADYDQALGGGVLMYQSRAAEIHDNIMRLQNDGVALYHCDSINVYDNDFSWNTSYGIRMFWTDTCIIHNNNASHVNRPYTDPSDCAALLMIISNANTITNNDLTWSGDGVFLGQYQHSNIPNNNYIAFNGCSYSPHNAIEATFADGNVIVGNQCNYSHYGLWLGYCFNTVVDMNEIKGNYNSGIAIDRGFSNEIERNQIEDNPIGIELWEGDPIPGYTTQTSKDYNIHENSINGNTLGISADKTEHSFIWGNDFMYNQAAAIGLNGLSSGDTIQFNGFYNTTAYHIRNNSTDPIYAMNNHFSPNDSLLIENHIFDKHDLGTKGQVDWYPPATNPPPLFQYEPPCDMAEPLSTWFAYPETGYPGYRIPDSLSVDSLEKVVGAASIRLYAGRGWDVALNYRPWNIDSVSLWSLTNQDTLYFWVRTIKQPQYGFQYFHVRIGNTKGGYYKYSASPNLLNAANLQWKQYKVPVTGSTQFARSTVGSMSLDSVSYVEFHADTWDYGYTLWVDGVQFTPCDPAVGIGSPGGGTAVVLENYPNPFRESTTIRFELEQPGNVVMEIFAPDGRHIGTPVNGLLPAGDQRIRFDASSLPSGIYYCRLQTEGGTTVRKMVLVR